MHLKANDKWKLIKNTLCDYTGCPRRNVPDFRRVFLMLKYTDITENTYVLSWTVTEIMAREKCGLLVGPRTVPVSWQPHPCPSLSVVSYYGNSAHARSKLFMYCLLGDKAVHVSAWHSCHVRGQSIKKLNLWNSQTASARSRLAMVALYSGDFKLYSDTSSITPPQLVIKWRALDWVCV